MDGALSLFHRATQDIRDYGEWDYRSPPTPGCACCGRQWSNVEEPDKALHYIYATGSFYADEWECTACHTARIRALKVLGIEGYRGKHKQLINPAKLGMLQNSGAIIAPDGKMYLALPEKFYEKLSRGLWAQRGQVFESTPMSLLMRMYFSGALADLDTGFVFIEKFGDKSPALMRNLRRTVDLSELWCCSRNGVHAIDMRAMLRIAAIAARHGVEKKATTNMFWKPILDAAKGRYDDEKFAAWLENTPGGEEMVGALPEDPHSRLSITRWLSEIFKAQGATQ